MPMLDQLGIVALPLLCYSLATCVALWTCIHSPSPESRRTLRAWGMVTFFLGLLGTLVGLQQTSAAVILAESDTVATLLAAGIEISLMPMIWGTLVATIALTGAATASHRWSKIRVHFEDSQQKSA